MAQSARTWYIESFLTTLFSLLTIGPSQYRAKDRPWYTLGHGIVLIYIGLGIITSVVYYFTLKAENARRDQGIRDEIIDGVNDNGRFISCSARPPSLTDLFLWRRRYRDCRGAGEAQRKVCDRQRREERKR